RGAVLLQDQDAMVPDARGDPALSTVCRPMSAAEDDAYLLRGLLWCDLCGKPMQPVLLMDIRQYACPAAGCPRPMVPAEPVETLVWNHFALLNEALAGGVPP